MKTILRPRLILFLLLSLITGVAYPLLVSAIGQALFPAQAAGSLIVQDGRVVGSSLIGQSFSAPGHFWGRPSATSPYPYNAALSGASNLGPTNPDLASQVKARIDALREADPGNVAPVPVDLVTTSASGLDPHISLAAAYYQTSRISRKKGIPEDAVRDIILKNTSGRLLGLIGEPVVNVLKVNLDLDSYKK